jgi:hypothetical protein
MVYAPQFISAVRGSTELLSVKRMIARRPSNLSATIVSQSADVSAVQFSSAEISMFVSTFECDKAYLV